ncbi:nucleotidyltransferase domain-containing protein [Mycobacteroides abscessus]|uniref:nucleotidyltransferase domain-containing protein n=1 Tax=Mycobacteroides abscessus TaxID=36809 RepID=UPI0013000568|nr:nucleotidyltransferase domain-containing protein [Mycobacteroides abscessus]
MTFASLGILEAQRVVGAILSSVATCIVGSSVYRQTMSLQGYTSTNDVRCLPEQLVDEIEQALVGPHLAVMVYGSQARGSADAGSDVDVLVVVERSPGSYSVGRVAVTAYTPAHLHAMAQCSSLFVLHLKSEGVVLEDEHGILARALSAYVPMEDFAAHWSSLRDAASVLNVSDGLFATHGQSIARLGLYVLRTALYLRSAQNGHPHFDMTMAAASTGHDVVRRACELRRARQFCAPDLRLVARAVEQVLSIEQGDLLESAHDLEKRAIAMSTVSPHASALLVNVLFGNGAVDYVGLAMAPW